MVPKVGYYFKANINILNCNTENYNNSKYLTAHLKTEK